MKDYHSRVAAALALAGRLDNDSTARRTLMPIVEEALRAIPEEMRRVSWQGLKMPRANLGGQDLSGFDLRDADLGGADLAGRVKAAGALPSTRRASSPPSSTAPNSRGPTSNMLTSATPV